MQSDGPHQITDGFNNLWAWSLAQAFATSAIMLGNAHANDASWGNSIAGSASGSKPVHTSSFVYTPTPPDAEGASAAVGVVVTSGSLQVDTHGAIAGTGSLLSLAEYSATLLGCSGSCSVSATCSQTSDPSGGTVKFFGLEFKMPFGASGTAVTPWNKHCIDCRGSAGQQCGNPRHYCEGDRLRVCKRMVVFGRGCNVRQFWTCEFPPLTERSTEVGGLPAFSAGEVATTSKATNRR
jgi:hypothetical protein